MKPRFLWCSWRALGVLPLFALGFVIVHCGDDDGGLSSAPESADGSTSSSPDGGSSSPTSDGASDAPVDEGPFTTWQLIRNQTASVDQIERLRASSSLAFILVLEGDYAVEARRVRDGSRAWRVDAPNAVDLHEWGDDVLVARSEPPVFERRLAADGTVVWSKPIPRSGIRRVTVTPDGIFALFGTTFGLASDRGWSIGRYDLQTGAPIWEKSTNPSDYVDGAGSLKVTAQGVYVGGVRKNGGPPYSTWYVEKRRADNGAPAWAKPYTIAAVQTNNSASSIDSDDEGVYVAGYMATTSTDPAEDAGIAERTLIVKLDANTGNEVWKTTVPFGSNNQGYGRAPSLVIDSDSVYVADSDRGGEAILAKLSKADGKPAWSKMSFAQGNANAQVFVARSGAALLAGGRSKFPDGGSIDTQIQLEKREAATGGFSAHHHLELTE